jgi:3-methyladenine DNA glycosylase AlkD
MRPLVRAARKALRDVADPAKAPIMQAYMKSTMPYLGIQATPLRRVARAVFSAHKLESYREWRDAVLELWRGARYREERYTAIELAGYPAYRKFRTLEALPMYEEMITSGAWWDYVNSIASHRLGELFFAYAKGVLPFRRIVRRISRVYRGGKPEHELVLLG